jgi:hypothetical protein
MLDPDPYQMNTDPKPWAIMFVANLNRILFTTCAGSTGAVQLQQQPGTPPAVVVAPPPRTARLRSGREERDVKSEPPPPPVAAAPVPVAERGPPPPPPTAVITAATTTTTSLPVASCVSRDYTLTVRSLRVTAGRRAALCEERRRIEAGKKILKVPMYATVL